jgi:rRNA-processing protein FCF1
MVFGFSFNKNIFDIVKKEFPKCEIVISDGVIRELSKIAENSGIKGMHAKTALLSIKSKNVKVHNNRGNVDSWIHKAAASYKNPVIITNDTALFKSLKQKGLNVFKLSKSGFLKN